MNEHVFHGFDVFREKSHLNLLGLWIPDAGRHHFVPDALVVPDALAGSLRLLLHHSMMADGTLAVVSGDRQQSRRSVYSREIIHRASSQFFALFASTDSNLVDRRIQQTGAILILNA
ncbi:hypothetical protein [Bradyrhizobium sp. sGM-13]|uniref:hypothetical protein n=1 Tax=Bradyrhizobium sp. sGM-13 TaxID=2831781 RepID=UPI001BD19962|nr:hypothetical protein [Bradyrhizobium sp. sGM-13]